MRWVSINQAQRLILSDLVDTNFVKYLCERGFTERIVKIKDCAFPVVGGDAVRVLNLDRSVAGPHTSSVAPCIVAKAGV